MVAEPRHGGGVGRRATPLRHRERWPGRVDRPGQGPLDRAGRAHGRRRSTLAGRHRPGSPVERGDDRAVEVGSVDPCTDRLETRERLGGRMAVRVVAADGDEREGRMRRRQERGGRRGPTAVVRDLQQVHRRQPSLEKGWIDALLGVTGEEDAGRADGPKQDERAVVDLGPRLGSDRRDGPAVWPEDLELDRVQFDPVARPERLHQLPPLGELGPERLVTRPRTGHPGPEDPVDAVPLEQGRQATDVILVRVGDDDQVEMAIPGRHPGIECDEQPLRVGAAVHEQSAASIALDEDRVALPHVEGDDPDSSVGPPAGGRDPADGQDEEGRQGDGRAASGSFGPVIAAGRGGPTSSNRSPCGERPGVGHRSGRDRDSASVGSRAPSSGPWSPEPATAPGVLEPDADRRQEADGQQRGGRGAEQVVGRGKLHRRSWNGGQDPDRADEGGQQGPAGHREDRRCEDSGPAFREAAAGEGEHARGHRRRDDGRDHEVRERGHQGQASERRQHDRQGRQLCRRRQGESLEQPAGQVPAQAGRSEPGLDP